MSKSNKSLDVLILGNLYRPKPLSHTTEVYYYIHRDVHAALTTKDPEKLYNHLLSNDYNSLQQPCSYHEQVSYRYRFDRPFNLHRIFTSEEGIMLHDDQPLVGLCSINYSYRESYGSNRRRRMPIAAVMQNDKVLFVPLRYLVPLNLAE
jgi:hypothetical protein